MNGRPPLLAFFADFSAEIEKRTENRRIVDFVLIVQVVLFVAKSAPNFSTGFLQKMPPPKRRPQHFFWTMMNDRID
jgi:hypothetical protein